MKTSTAVMTIVANLLLICAAFMDVSDKAYAGAWGLVVVVAIMRIEDKLNA